MRPASFLRMFVLPVLLLVSACLPTPAATLEPMVVSSPTVARSVTPTSQPTQPMAPKSIPPGTPTAVSNPTEPASPTPVTSEGGNANVLHVRAILAATGSWTFHVTVEHPDIGWEDYADGWDVLTPAGEVLKPDPDSPFTRLLLHPHESEQPFTRSQSGIIIPEDVTQVRVRAHDLVDGYGGREVVVDLAQSSGPGFEVQR